MRLSLLCLFAWLACLLTRLLFASSQADKTAPQSRRRRRRRYRARFLRRPSESMHGRGANGGLACLPAWLPPNPTICLASHDAYPTHDRFQRGLRRFRYPFRDRHSPNGQSGSAWLWRVWFLVERAGMPACMRMRAWDHVQVKGPECIVWFCSFGMTALVGWNSPRGRSAWPPVLSRAQLWCFSSAWGVVLAPTRFSPLRILNQAMGDEGSLHSVSACRFYIPKMIQCVKDEAFRIVGCAGEWV